jgi:hypothetical protein
MSRLACVAAVAFILLPLCGAEPRRERLRPVRFSEGGGYEWKGVFHAERVGGENVVFLYDARDASKRIRLTRDWADIVVRDWKKYECREVRGSSWKDEEPLAFRFLDDPAPQPTNEAARALQGNWKVTAVDTEGRCFVVGGPDAETETFLTVKDDSFVMVTYCRKIDGRRPGTRGSSGRPPRPRDSSIC